VALPVALIGLLLTSHDAVAIGATPLDGATGFVFQPLYDAITLLIPLGDHVLHPTAFAAWVGFLVTAINLLPVGQLDGGHIARGLLGPSAVYLGYITFAVLVITALFTGGWILFALLVLILGIKHPAPLNDISKLDRRTQAIGVVSMIVLLVTFVPQPIVTIAADASFEMHEAGANATDNSISVITFDLTNGTHIAYAILSLEVVNLGDSHGELEVSVPKSPNWLAVSMLVNGDDDVGEPARTIRTELPYQGNVTISVDLSVEDSNYLRNALDPGDFTFLAKYGGQEHELKFKAQVLI